MPDAPSVDFHFNNGVLYQYGQFYQLFQDEAFPQSGFGSPMQTDDPIRLLDSDNPRAQSYVPEHAFHEIGILNSQQERDAVPCPKGSKPRKGARKRERDKNWTDEETAVLVECKRAAFHDNGSPFRKPKSKATDWDAISQELKNNSVTRASEKTGSQCRLRWDTMVKSHRIIKEKCVQQSKGYAELTEEEMGELKLATMLDKEWYEAIDTISCKGRSKKQGKQSPGVGDYAVFESRMATDRESNQLFLEGTPAGSAPNSSPSSLRTGDLPGRPKQKKSSRKQIVIPGFSSMEAHLRDTLLNLILDAGFLEGRYYDPDEIVEEYEDLPLSCRWLSIVQNRSCSGIYHDVTMLVKMKLVHISVGDYNEAFIDRSRFRVFDKYVKKVIFLNPVYNTHLRIAGKTTSTWTASSIQMAVKVLKLHMCEELKTANLRGLRTLRSLSISNCTKLVEVTGWKFLRELGWLEIEHCPSYAAYPDLRDLPSLREFRFNRRGIRECPPRHGLDVSHCARLRRLEIWCDELLKDSGDLSSLKCLETLSFQGCSALSTISGLSELHLLTSLNLDHCFALRSLPYIGHMRELGKIAILGTHLEEIPGVEKLVSLTTLDCSWSHLKRLPDLHHLPVLQYVTLTDTPLIEDDPTSFYFDKEDVSYNDDKRAVYVDVSDVSDEENNLLVTTV